ncbi:metallophosphoesterase [Micromonospora sp. WMMD980]|uniref:metallophosphoesterase n=1 Tax=Micromonospora sp. WMMD980 TaxID=3016088 RepID=UPI0024167197|nr:metallophosphoesterase [Micromonospora sp. WMMD980]MDG4804067.1 metallophosphoesterase [Micromonospora sp. WMMD980]
MLAMATFVGLVVLVIGLIHFYLWKRMVRDTTRPGPWRRGGAVVAILLALLVPATMAGTQNGFYWLAWPGYLWLALMFYLLVLLLVLEVPAAVVRLALRRRARSAAAAGPEPEPALVGAGGPARPGDAHPAGRTGDAGSPTPPDGADDTPPTGDAGDLPATGAGAPDHDPSRRLLLARGAAIFAGLTAAGVTGYGVRTAMGPPQLDRVRIPLAKLPRSMDGLRIATVSDIHLGPLRGRAHTERIVAMINRLDADLVAVVGDLVDGSVAELGAAAEPLRDLRSRYGSFFVTGNHEYYSGVEEWVREVDRLGLRVLQNARQEIRARGGVLDLAGVNDVTADGTGLAAPADYAAALGDRDPSRPVVLLAHQPVAAHEAAKFGVDLQLSGHTHGGQMVPFNLAVKLQQPVVSGLGEVDGTKVYVTNGAGFWGPPVRVGAPPQVTLVELRAP